MSEPKKIGFVFIPAFADWEFGLLSGPAADWFGLKTVALTPGGQPVTSIGGFGLNGARSFHPAENADLDAVAVIGSDTWPSADAPDVSPLLHAVAERGGLVGGICGGTLALARAGLFDGVEHTSNGRDWILKHLPDYAGRERYRDVPHAVADGHIVSAPGSAPGTFAVEFLAALLPGKAGQFAEMRALFAGEYGKAS
ncbi:MAG: DJ-1/PfpI family protein [Mesorhizobium sp.]|nr:DJ-1/PfpI family protein [Mesorhizobium sp.]MBN9242601.1 DJ-1/PfpI family protein [Mesorhizobium sp.]